MREFPRSQRVGEQIQRVLAALIRASIRDPRLGMVTVSAVKVSRDLSHARVFVTVLGDKSVAEQSVQVLNRAAGFLRKELGREMIMRVVPTLNFVEDVSIQRGTHLDSLITDAVAADVKKAGR